MLSGSAGADTAHEDATGGRIGVLAGPEGVFMVDSQCAQLTGKVAAAIRKIGPEPIRFLVNRHVHPDHTAGSAGFVKMGHCFSRGKSCERSCPAHLRQATRVREETRPVFCGHHLRQGGSVENCGSTARSPT
jgi:glyoxylase-like metal-dependent hydrolase (beta-lactamase superfamily II)